MTAGHSTVMATVQFFGWEQAQVQAKTAAAATAATAAAAALRAPRARMQSRAQMPSRARSRSRWPRVTSCTCHRSGRTPCSQRAAR